MPLVLFCFFPRLPTHNRSESCTHWTINSHVRRDQQSGSATQLHQSGLRQRHRVALFKKVRMGGKTKKRTQKKLSDAEDENTQALWAAKATAGALEGLRPPPLLLWAFHTNSPLLQTSHQLSLACAYCFPWLYGTTSRTVWSKSTKREFSQVVFSTQPTCFAVSS